MYPDRFAPAEAERLGRALDQARSPLARAAIAAGLSEHARVQTQHEQVQRLTEALGLAPLALPYLFAEQIGPPELAGLADHLEALLLASVLRGPDGRSNGARRPRSGA
jgi:hypothetical protein